MKNSIVLICLIFSTLSLFAQEFDFTPEFIEKVSTDFCNSINEAEGATFPERMDAARGPFVELLESEKYEKDLEQILDGRDFDEVSPEAFGGAVFRAMNETMIINCDIYYYFFRDLRQASFTQMINEFGNVTYLKEVVALSKKEGFLNSGEDLAYAGIVMFSNNMIPEAIEYLASSVRANGPSDAIPILLFALELNGQYDDALDFCALLPDNDETNLQKAMIKRAKLNPGSHPNIFPDEDAVNDYFLAWQIFETDLTQKIKSPQSYSDFEAEKDGIKLIEYESEGLKLKGLLDTKNIEEGKKKPAIVYLHGGWALGYSDVTDCKAFTDAGYVVFAPSYRGENGNDGNFEFFLGEVNDAKAAIKWLQSQPYIDAENVSVFGHSAGGALALALSLHPDIDIDNCGGVAGVFGEDSFEYWKEEEGKVIPFDLEDENEVYMRLPVAFLNDMERNHYLYIGTDDDFEYEKEWLNEIYENDIPEKLKLIEVPGNHFTSLAPAMKLFLEEIKK